MRLIILFLLCVLTMVATLALIGSVMFAQPIFAFLSLLCLSLLILGIYGVARVTK